MSDGYISGVGGPRVEPGAKRCGGPGGARAFFFVVLIMARMIGYVVPSLRSRAGLRIVSNGSSEWGVLAFFVGFFG